MAVFLAWSSATLSDHLPADLPGPWLEVRVVASDLTLVDSTDSLSRVYHELKWALPDGAALIVVPLEARPKLKGLPTGTTSWLRDRIGST